MTARFDNTYSMIAVISAAGIFDHFVILIELSAAAALLKRR